MNPALLLLLLMSAAPASAKKASAPPPAKVDVSSAAAPAVPAAPAPAKKNAKKAGKKAVAPAPKTVDVSSAAAPAVPAAPAPAKKNAKKAGKKAEAPAPKTVDVSSAPVPSAAVVPVGPVAPAPAMPEASPAASITASAAAPVAPSTSAVAPSTYTAGGPATLTAGPEAPALPAVPSAPKEWVQIIYPEEGAKYPFVTRSFTLGNVAPGSSLTINGARVPVHPAGGFLAMVDFATGPFVLRYEASLNGLTAAATRMVEVAQPHGLPSSRPEEAVAYEPAESLALLPGDLLVARCKGPMGSTGTFRVDGLAKELPMAENPAIPTVYEGHYFVQPGDAGEGLEITCSLRTPRKKTLKAEAKGKLTVLDPRNTRVAVTTAKSSVLKSAKSGYSLFLPPGVRVETAGRVGDSVRIKLSEHEESWANSSDLRFLPEGTPPPHSEVGMSVSIVAAPSSTKVVIRSSERVPFEVAHSIEPLGFEVRFFGASHHLDRIRYRPDDPVVKDIRWRQEDSRVVRFSVETELWWGWGYDAYYDERGNFVLEIRRPPDLSKGDVLRGRKIVLDPGHGPGSSAVGPLGTTERDVNLAIGLQLRDLLQKEGAEVYMIRTSSDGPPLGDRPFLAWEAKGDLYLSLHNNALPMNADPFEGQRGYMNFFYQSQSRPLAEAVHRSYNKERKEMADEGLWWGNLAVCRTPQMPAMLTESAYMIFPEQEARLRLPSYQKEVAQTLLEGIRSFYDSYRELQLRRKQERRAARTK